MNKFTAEQVEQAATSTERCGFSDWTAILRAYAERLRQDDRDAKDAAAS